MATTRWLRRLGVAGLFTGLTLVMTWPLGRVLATRSIEHFDVFFNLWRLRWIHHALATSPGNLFDGNQFYPEPGVLAYSDAVLLQGLLGAPLLAAGLPPVLVHNLLLLGGMAGSGLGMFVLARHLSGDTSAGIIGGIVFAFAPFRFGHIMHLELQWAMWAPLAFYAVQRTLETGRWRFALLAGIFVALQFLSCIYYGLFLGLMLLVVTAAQLPGVDRANRTRVFGRLAAGGALALLVCLPYALPYRTASARVGIRGEAEVARWSATPGAYLRVSETNVLYRRLGSGGDEMSLFPGAVPVALGIVALAAGRRRRWAYALGLVVAVDLSLGLHGFIYRQLYDHVAAFRGLRAPSRAAIFALLCLAVLASCGAAVFLRRAGGAARAVLAGAMSALILLEYRATPLRLIDYANVAPPLYAFLNAQPSGPVAHFPLPRYYRLMGYEPRYVFGSTFHWKPVINGYSGYYPPSYRERVEALTTFPDGHSLAALKAAGVRYAVVHEANYRSGGEAGDVLTRLHLAGAKPLARLNDGYGAASVFLLP